MTRWIKRFSASTRGRVLGLLRRGERTVNELAEALGITDNAVRAQLSSLERDGLVRQSGARPGVRKPHSAYELSPEAEPFFPKAYGPLLQQVLDVLSSRLSPGELDKILRTVGSRIAAAQLLPPSATFDDRLAHALKLLEELGGLAELERGKGKLFIRGYSCPLAAAVAACPQACHLAETLVAEVVGTPVRQRCDQGDPPRCRFEVSPAAPTA